MALVDCGTGSTFISSNRTPAYQDLTIDGFIIKIQPWGSYSLNCVGEMNVTTSHIDLVYRTVPMPSPSVSFDAPFSFLAGLICALVFVSASLKKW